MSDDHKSNEKWALAPRFRLVRVGGKRRGIRLEEVYWGALDELAASRDEPLGEVIAQCEGRLNEGANLTSALRVEAVKYLRNERDAIRSVSELNAVENQVQACPTPCFALSDDKRLIAQNPAFIHFVQTRFPLHKASQGVHLSLAMPFAELIDRLKAEGTGLATVGFVIGVAGQTVRGQLNAILAPMADRDAIIAFVLPN
ncbi:ribbon-helix-helix domain-containing protein [Nitratireductor aquimarinus]|uniref:ribbon-helix-helix domain-containing protein n=1 Tax=Nitratireductor TaxID=245876 RepID=UPI0019D3B0E5|nr:MULTISPECIES: ribbon-helix-helix domain-containing protein [Nitratireductor]MBN7761839.1 ribbon-helix-helix domain-containing protein [Nitratireductor aquibiodomus]MBN8244121.1 ribbon-helix-helix domain-containing protein [Nitratireductor aquimarinus]MBY6131655.1 ribbon-helix-helix domain-containing protein [Nitratireductor aquimarinus]MCA1301190.1 ribbon-helix-helix domain-containing protein [Nitratireductor aquimarinus]